VDVKHYCSCDTKHVIILGQKKKKYETLYFSVSLSQRSITYASLEDVRGEEEWWRGTEQSYYTAVARVWMKLYCYPGVVFCLSRGTKCNGVSGHRLRSKAIWTSGSKRQSQLSALSATRSCGLRNYMKWNNQMFRKILWN